MFDRDTGSLAELSARLFASDEAREGMSAFLERRDPGWVHHRPHGATRPGRTAVAPSADGCWNRP